MHFETRRIVTERAETVPLAQLRVLGKETDRFVNGEGQNDRVRNKNSRILRYIDFE